jgi:hypothetical protein
MQKAAKTAKEQRRNDAAQLWGDAVSHLEHMNTEIKRLSGLLERHAGHTQDCRWQWEFTGNEGKNQGIGKVSDYCDCGFLDIHAEFIVPMLEREDRL